MAGENSVKKNNRSWRRILAWTILLFPVAMYYIKRKLDSNPVDYVRNGEKVRWFGISMLVLMVLIVINEPNKTAEEAGAGIVWTVLVLTIMGIYGLIIGQMYIKMGKKNARYLSLIFSGENPLIAEIAREFPTSYNQAVRDIQRMIDDQGILHASLDLQQGRIYVGKKPAESATPNVQKSTNTAQDIPSAVSSAVIKCPNCGAPNRVYSGRENVCEYCESVLPDH